MNVHHDLTSLFWAALFALLMLSCGQADDQNFIIDDVPKVTLQVTTLPDSVIFHLSNFARLQSQNDQLFITSFIPQNDTVIYSWNPHTQTRKGVYRLGRGPNEIGELTASSRSAVTSELFFIDVSANRLFTLSPSGQTTAMVLPAEVMLATPHEFTVTHGRFMWGAYSNIASSHAILSSLELETGSVTHLVAPRVEPGFEPHMRNHVSAIAALPNGVAYSLLGDRGVIIRDTLGQVLGSVVFGPDDDIVTFKSHPNQNQPSSAQPYISKMEYFDPYLYVLVEGRIFAVDIHTEQITYEIEIVDEKNQIVQPIMDFTISNKFIFVRSFPRVLHQGWRAVNE